MTEDQIKELLRVVLYEEGLISRPLTKIEIRASEIMDPWDFRAGPQMVRDVLTAVKYAEREAEEQ